ncbi:hypothetical protein PY650_13960 [Rhizobium calliandrae]|uniref:Integrase n=1 Tax=Rhizobium calliandrae TaxID=1312182 RepID=A0ABT7KHG0_9HYPH|nr:hypothetical protein [Rhizobium calliandrae]MDL2406748.1 hypothetical protein [Rhizobium calliandrae]
MSHASAQMLSDETRDFLAQLAILGRSHKTAMRHGFEDMEFGMNFCAA